jgi:hypothetical protein
MGIVENQNFDAALALDEYFDAAQAAPVAPVHRLWLPVFHNTNVTY